MRFKIAFGIILAICFSAGARISNWNGTEDTSQVFVNNISTIKYGKAWVLTNGENLRLKLIVNDTATAGSGADSTKMAWGYQIGDISKIGGAICTTWSDFERVVIDTMRADSAGHLHVGVQDSAGNLTVALMSVDTLGIAGYMAQTRPVYPPWNVLIRGWALGVTGTKLSTANRVIFQLLRRIATQTMESRDR